MFFEILSAIIDGLGLAGNIGTRKWRSSISSNLDEMVALLRAQSQYDAESIGHWLPKDAWRDWENVLQPSTVILVTGCHYLCEVFDRTTAYVLKTIIDRIARKHYELMPLYSLVVGDVCYWKDDRINCHRNVLSIGGPTVNSLTQDIAQNGQASIDTGKISIVEQGHRCAIYGHDPIDTLEAMKQFSSSKLMNFLQRAWK